MQEGMRITRTRTETFHSCAAEAMVGGSVYTDTIIQVPKPNDRQTTLASLTFLLLVVFLAAPHNAQPVLL